MTFFRFRFWKEAAGRTPRIELNSSKQPQATLSLHKKRKAMKTRNLFKAIALALGCATLAMTTAFAEARDIKAHAGSTFVNAPVEFDAHGNPTKFAHTVDGVLRVYSLGNCTFHADVVAVPRPDGTFALSGTFRITSADGNTTLDGEVQGATAPDESGNPAFANFHYDVKFTGGTGRMDGARGKGDIDGFGITSPDFSTGKATWLLQGNVTSRGGHDE